MKRLFFIISLLLCLPLAAQQIYRARVVDSATGEPLPYVNVCTAHRKTISNAKGYFAIWIDSPREYVQLTHVGYEKQSVNTASKTSVIKLKPSFHEMKEVVIFPFNVDDVLNRIVKRLKKDYTRSADIETMFFMRSMLQTEMGNEMQECFLAGKSAVNFREPAVISGKLWCETDDMNQESMLRHLNTHVLLGLGPYVSNSPFWATALFPLHKIRRSRGAYEPTLNTQVDDNGNFLYKIDLRHGFFQLKGYDSLRPDEKPAPVIIGDIYADEEYRLLRFDGEAHFVMLRSNEKAKRITVKFQVEYTHERGFTEVSHMHLEGKNEDYTFDTILLNLGDESGEKYPAVLVKSNLLDAMRFAGYDERMWEQYSIVQRTIPEEQIAKGSEARGQNFD